MIESISITNTSSFGNVPEILGGLSQFNFLFGSNGTGKTTISRIIAEEALFPACNMAWKAGTKLQTMVYNRDFVEKNFNQSMELKGVFTLGEKQVDTLNKIAGAKEELDKLTKRIETLAQGLQSEDGKTGKIVERTSVDNVLKDKCWAQKQKHDAKLHSAFEGFRNNSEKFKGKVLVEWVTNTATLRTLADLEKKAETVFGTAPANEQFFAPVDTSKLIDHESNPILKKRVIGKDDVDIAAMVKKLGNSDWVREGRTFFDANGSLCPFCQQRTTDAFADSLKEYFDETFIADTKAINDLASNYSTDAARIQQQLGSIVAAPSRFLDVDKLKLEKELLASKITINIQRLASKKKETSQVVELESLANVTATIKSLIDTANTLIVQHNKMVANLSQERATLTAEVWKFVLEELKIDLDAYKETRNGLSKAIDSMNEQLASTRAAKAEKTAQLRELEKQTTSVQPTIDAINALLSSFGFQSFLLAKAVSGTSYKLVRADGSDAKTTLSEGERTFVTFLYFYHLLKGSDSETGMTTDRVVVFDDPVSSLDSDILFIVASLIKGLFEEVRLSTGHIKQIFVLTHNVYFHKEVTYNRNRQTFALKDETFWVIRKPGSSSKLDKHAANPIKTSYELLWAELRKPERANLAIQNTMRRILENYFKILGGIEFEQLCSMFEGQEKMICKSLCSWVHDGSHYAHDDLYVSIEDSMVDKYLSVFRKIFQKSGHLSHYQMMMGDAFVPDPPAITQPLASADSSSIRN